MPLFHFSESGDIDVFTPRPVLKPATRAEGREWLNGPLVWAIDDWHQPMYLFPRECPRILVWPLATTTDHDRELHWRERDCRMVAYIERSWHELLCCTVLFRYELPAATFGSLGDAGMWVSKERVAPIAVTRIDCLPDALREAQVELRPMERLDSLKPLFDTTIHVSGIRLRNATTFRRT